mmetsp:Transcript_9466/g.23631  ORF Transcript_9466/g.23631 Transcript_9466/m.23631 type:complete len:82 (-) Transcript_9466:13-258(-)
MRRSYLGTSKKSISAWAGRRVTFFYFFIIKQDCNKHAQSWKANRVSVYQSVGPYWTGLETTDVCPFQELACIEDDMPTKKT